MSAKEGTNLFGHANYFIAVPTLENQGPMKRRRVSEIEEAKESGEKLGPRSILNKFMAANRREAFMRANETKLQASVDLPNQLAKTPTPNGEHNIQIASLNQKVDVVQKEGVSMAMALEKQRVATVELDKATAENKKSIMALEQQARDCQQVLSARTKEAEQYWQDAMTWKAEAKECKQELANLRSKEQQTKKELHRLLNLIREGEPNLYQAIVMDDRFIDLMF